MGSLPGDEQDDLGRAKRSVEKSGSGWERDDSDCSFSQRSSVLKGLRITLAALRKQWFNFVQKGLPGRAGLSH